MKEFKDVQGDEEMGVQSLPVVLGPRKAAAVTVPVYIAASLLLLPFFWLYDLSDVFLPFFGLGLLGKILASVTILRDPSDARKGSKALVVELGSTIFLLLGASISAMIKLL